MRKSRSHHSLRLLAALVLIGPLLLTGQSNNRKVALVIGNAAYAIKPLRNPANDAVDVAAALRALGFEVSQVIDADQSTMKRRIDDFGAAVRGAAIALFYYSGHGVQVGKENYLIPIGANIELTNDVEYEAVQLGRVLAKMEDARAATNILVLDACRDNPFPGSEKSGGSRGLAVVEKKPPESLIVYATEAGETAADGEGRNGTFTEAFLKNISRSDDVYTILLDVKQQVQAASGFKQRPATYDNLSSKIYLGGTGPEVPDTAEIIITSTPADAEVYIDGVLSGKAGDLLSLPTGRELGIKVLKGNLAAETKLILRRGELRDLSLILAPLKGNLYLKTKGAADCQVTIDGRDYGAFGLGVFRDLDSGTHAVVVRGPGLLWKGAVDVLPQKTGTMDFLLGEIGSLDLRLPADATVRVSSGGKTLLEHAGAVLAEDLPIGFYDLEASGLGYSRTTGFVAITRGATARWEPWTTGRLQITTDPSGASVYLNDERVGLSPIVLENLSPGWRRIRTVLADYEESSGTAMIAVGKTVLTNIKLEIQKRTIDIAVPADAMTRIANQGRGVVKAQTGAGQVSGLPVGTYTLESGGTGYESARGTVTVTRNGTVRWGPWTTGNLAITTEPSGAEVFVDGKSVGRSPVTASSIAPGSRVIKAVLDDYDEATANVTVLVGKAANVKLTLAVSKGSIDVRVPGDVKTRLINSSRGIDTTQSGSVVINDLPIGIYELESFGADYESTKNTVTVSRGFASIWEPWTTGNLVITTDPSGADVFVDGKSVGRSPATTRNLTAGQTGVIAKLDGYEDTAAIMTITVGKLAVGLIRLTKKSIIGRTALRNEVLIPGGIFTMGSPASETGHGSEEGPQHQVTLSPFWMMATEVTQKDYAALMGTNPSYFKGEVLPVEQVAWYDAVAYANKLSQRDGLTPAYSINGTMVSWDRTASGWRLPTEAEWEYACRAGTTTPFSSGNNLITAQANYNGNYPNNGNAKGEYRQKTMPVRSFPANAWGLYEMHGNVWEWCWDWYGSYNATSQTAPMGVASGTSRVIRGGSWGDAVADVRSASRYDYSPGSRDGFVGFRVLRPIIR